MGYAAVALALLGVAVGAMFRLKILLLIVGLVLLVSFTFSVASGYTFLHTAATIMVTQTILQSCYFIGCVARSMLSINGTRHIL